MNPTIYQELWAQSSGLRRLISVPFIYMMIVPLFALDFFLEIYHQIAFRLYAIPTVDRNEYIFLDRNKLSKLTPIQKLNCTYCGYANGLLAYGVKIAGETEKYWCAIKHEGDVSNVQPQQKEFLERADFE